MKVLLLTDVPPCKDFSGAMLTLQLCKLLPRDSLVCYGVVNPELDGFPIDPDLGAPFEKTAKPRELGCRHKNKYLGGMRTFFNEMRTAKVEIPRIADAVAAFGKRHGVDRLWCILQGQTMIRLALPVSRRLNVPLLTQIWDHPSWWLDAHGVDGVTSRFVLWQYERVLRRSTRIGAASFVMAEEYQNRYGIPAIPFLGSLDRRVVRLPSWTPPVFSSDHETILIGLAGQIYSKQEWNSLLAALDSAHWTVAGKRVKLRFLGRPYEVEASSLGPEKLEVLGYLPQEETIRRMAECDILYCPYFFDEKRKEISRTSFPSKVTTYLAAGRPILYHGPDYASPAIFLREHGAAEFCHSLATGDILGVISRLATDESLYRTVAENGHAAMLEHLTFESLKAYLYRFLGMEADDTPSHALQRPNFFEKEAFVHVETTVPAVEMAARYA
jgi:hypothetical protein